jgi:6-phosphogluconolactonase
LAYNLAEQIAVWLKKALLEKQRALLAVAGGRTPILCFEALSKIDINWKRVDIVLVDERWVDDYHVDSHARLVKRHLLQNLAMAANFVPLKTTHETPFEACATLEKKLSALQWPIDVLVLGMGNDGHTASLFPSAEGLEYAMTTADRCAAVIPPKAPHQRITLSYSALKKAENKVLYITGNTKTEVMTNVLKKVEDVNSMPIRGFLDSKLTTYWSA